MSYSVALVMLDTIPREVKHQTVTSHLQFCMLYCKVLTKRQSSHFHYVSPYISFACTTGPNFLQICQQPHVSVSDWAVRAFSPSSWQRQAHLASTGHSSLARIPTDALGSVIMLVTSHWIWLIFISWTGGTEKATQRGRKKYRQKRTHTHTFKDSTRERQG